MKIDLTKVKVQPSLLQESRIENLQPIVADLLWQECGGKDIKKADFALRLFNSKGEIEITNDEKEYILSILPNVKYWLSKAITELLEEKC